MRGSDRMTRIKVSHSAAYRHFPDKTAILAAVAELGFRELKQRMETAQGEPWVRLQAKGVGYVLFAAEHPGYFRAMFHSDLCGKDQYPELTAEAQACSRDLTQAIEACLGPNGCSQEAIARAAGRAWPALPAKLPRFFRRPPPCPARGTRPPALCP